MISNYFKALLGLTMITAISATASAAFVINEIDPDTPGSDADEFVELKGNPNESTDGLIVVFYDGTASGCKVYRAFDLNGYQADSNGYFVIADVKIPGAQIYQANGFLQNGEDAVALHTGSIASYTTGTLATTTNLVDAIVYKGNLTQASQNWSGLGSPTIYNESALGNPAGQSFSRIPDGVGSFALAEPSPLAANAQVQSFTINNVDFLRQNQATALVATTQTVTIKNTGTAPLAVNTFALSPASSIAFTQLGTATPAAPVTLQYNESTSLTVQFLETDVSTNKSYNGSVTYTTDNPTSPSGSIVFSIDLVRATQTAAVGDVKINEICYNPGTIDHNNDGSTAGQNDEYVELFNMTGSPILIEGWEQRCTDASGPIFHSYVFPLGATLPANGFVTVFTSGNPTGFTTGTVFTYNKPRISNGGGYVGISDATKLVDGVAYLTGQDSPDTDAYLNTNLAATVAGGSQGRRPDGSNNFRLFSPVDPILTDRTTPNTSNNDFASISEWSLFD